MFESKQWNSLDKSRYLYQGGYDISRFEKSDLKIETVRYKVNLEYPKLDVLGFYRKLFSSMGYISCDAVNKKYNDDGWTTYIDGTGKIAKYVHRVMHFWRNPQDTEVIFLLVRYESPLKIDRKVLPGGQVADKVDGAILEKLEKRPSSNMQIVILQKMPSTSEMKNCNLLGGS
jgi:hypothetical protein